MLTPSQSKSSAAPALDRLAVAKMKSLKRLEKIQEQAAAAAAADQEWRGMRAEWGGLTAIAQPILLDVLPEGKPYLGFRRRVSSVCSDLTNLAGSSRRQSSSELSCCSSGGCAKWAHEVPVMKSEASLSLREASMESISMGSVSGTWTPGGCAKHVYEPYQPHCTPTPRNSEACEADAIQEASIDRTPPTPRNSEAVEHELLGAPSMQAIAEEILGFLPTMQQAANRAHVSRRQETPESPQQQTSAPTESDALHVDDEDEDLEQAWWFALAGREHASTEIQHPRKDGFGAKTGAPFLLCCVSRR